MQPAREGLLGGTTVPDLGPVLEFMRSVWALDHSLQITSKRMDAMHGITAPQRFVIRILGRFPGTPAGLLASILHLHPSTLTGVLDRLERRGLITRRADPRDRRRAVFGLTPEGRALDVETEGTVESAVRTALEQLPDAKVRDTVEVLSRLSVLLAAAAASAPDEGDANRGSGR